MEAKRWKWTTYLKVDHNKLNMNIINIEQPLKNKMKY